MPGMTLVAPLLLPGCRASMRPRLNAGDDEQAEARIAEAQRASMRPRLNAGDDKSLTVSRSGATVASMRPRLNAGDD